MDVRPFHESLIGDLVALQNQLVPSRRRTNASELCATLMDFARRRGDNVRIFFERNELTGYLGWVEGPHGEFFASPFYAKTEVTAKSMFEFLLNQACGKAWIRVSTFPEETHKESALRIHHFRPVFEFFDFEANPTNHTNACLPEGITDQEITTSSPSEFARLNNETFAGVDNSLPISEEEGKDTLSSPLLSAVLSRVWRNKSGEALAFSIGNSDGYLESIAVVPAAQRKGLGTQLFNCILARAANAGFTKVSTTVSSRNDGSLRMHRRLGISEVERRTVWERALNG